MPAQRSFEPALFKFLRDLAANNDRTWFTANKQRYDKHIKDPGIQFILDFGPHLQKITKHFMADPRPVGGSMFRIFRDTRFSKDKSPYKRNSGLQFRHEAGKDAHAPGFYLHLEPGKVFAGIGLWRPESAVARKVRDAIANDPKSWKTAAYGKRFAELYEIGGETLKRPPPGFDAAHPYIEDLKRKDFVAMVSLREKDVTAPGFVETYAKLCKTGVPFMKFLCEAMGLPF